MLSNMNHFRLMRAHPKTTGAEEFVGTDPSKIVSKCIVSDT